MNASLIITQLPSCLDMSPLFPVYDDFLSCALEKLQKDIELTFCVPRAEILEQRLFRLRLQASATHRGEIPEEHMRAEDRLISACLYSPHSLECLDWLYQLYHRVITDSKLLDRPGVSLITHPYKSGAYLEPFIQTLHGEYPTGENADRSGHYRSEWLRRGIHERVREDFSDQRLARWLGWPMRP